MHEYMKKALIAALLVVSAAFAPCLPNVAGVVAWWLASAGTKNPGSAPERWGLAVCPSRVTR
jgi:hypothetical protein